MIAWLILLARKINILLGFPKDSPQLSTRSFPCYEMRGNDAEALTANPHSHMIKISTIFQKVTMLSVHDQQSFEFIVIFNVGSSAF